MTGTPILQAALKLKERGYEPVPVHAGQKRPIGEDWQNRRLTTEEIARWFGAGKINLGVLLGAPSGNLVDIDEDAPEIVRLADAFLPPTAMVFGRTSKPRSHRLYKTTVEWKTRKFTDPDGTMLVELRSIGGQTVVPPSVHTSGEHIEFECDGDPALIVGQKLEERVARLAAAGVLVRRWKEGNRQNAALALAGGLLRGGWNVKTTAAFIRAVAVAAGDPEAGKRAETAASTKARLDANDMATGWSQLVELMDERGVRRVLKWLGMGCPSVEGQAARVVTALGEERQFYTDLGNAQRLVKAHAADLRYCHARKTWLLWDGRRWVADGTDEVERRAKSAVRAMYEEALTLNDNERVRLMQHATRSEAQGRIRSMIALAQSEPGIPATLRELDADPFLLNVLNGTLNLRTGELRPHRREDLITRLAPVEYDPEARLPMWDDFLASVTDGDEALTAFLQRVAGYALTGDTGEEVLLLVHGPGASGKSTFVEAIKAVLGDYATVADFEAFLDRRNASGPRNDIARLTGYRFVASVEVDDGRKLAHSLVKQLTGGDTVTARFLYQEAFEFVPQFKLFLVANHAPRVSDTDGAIWRRLLRVPFDHVVPKKERDARVKATLRNPKLAGPAILAWAVRGALAWQLDGLRVPTAVEEATIAYRAAMDPLQAFISACCRVEPDATATPAELWAEYTSWCLEAGVAEPLRQAEFGARLKELGFQPKKGGKGIRRWRGIGIVGPRVAEVA